MLKDTQQPGYICKLPFQAFSLRDDGNSLKQITFITSIGHHRFLIIFRCFAGIPETSTV